MLARLWNNENIGSQVGYIGNQTRGSAVGVRCHSHYATHYCCARNCCYVLSGYMGWKCRKVWAPKLVIKMEEKTKQKQIGSGVGGTMKITWNVRSVNDEKGPVVRWKLSKAAAWCNGREAVRVDCYTWRGLRSLNSLRVVTIPTIDTFIRGCYL